jgi:nitrate reductase NapE component
MASTYQLLPPYVMKTPNGKPGGILPQMIQRMTSSCCGTCSGTVVDFDRDGLGEIAEKDTYPDLLKSLDQSTSFAFPIVGFAGTNKYKSQFGFIPAVETPGMVVMVKKKSAENITLTVLWSVFGIWPILLINVVLALIAGIVMWMLVGREIIGLLRELFNSIVSLIISLIIS